MKLKLIIILLILMVVWQSLGVLELPSIIPRSFEYDLVKITYYCGSSCFICNERFHDKTATMTSIYTEGIATDPSVIPYGSRVWIEDLGKWFTVDDCGGKMKFNWRKHKIIHIDVRVPNTPHEAVERMGKHFSKVIVLRKD